MASSCRTQEPRVVSAQGSAWAEHLGHRWGGEGRHLATRWSRTKVSMVRGEGADSWEHLYLGFPELWVLYLSHTSCTAVNN